MQIEAKRCIREKLYKENGPWSMRIICMVHRTWVWVVPSEEQQPVQGAPGIPTHAVKFGSEENCTR